MNWEFKKMWPAAAMSIVALSTVLTAADRRDRDKMKCPPKQLPDQEAMNPSARPFTLDACCCEEGEFSITVAGFYWKPTQDGMEYAIDNEVINTAYQGTLVDADYLNPHFDWDLGFKVGVGYNSTHDGWDVQLLWTHFHGRAHDHEEAELDDNHTLLPLWSAFAMPAPGATTQGILFATDIETHWTLKLDMFDVELGREFWTSKRLSLRPHIGVRAAWIRQKYEIEHKGGSWSTPFAGGSALNNEVDIKNNFKGVGVRGGLDSEWYFNDCWGLFGNVALSILYGRFSVDHDEDNRLAVNPFTKADVLDTEDHFHSSRAITDLILGIQYNTMFKEDTYGFTLALAWEHHMFFDQNQMWRVVRIGDNAASGPPSVLGENVFHQRRGDLATQGWTLTATLTF